MYDMTEPIKSLIEELGQHLSRAPHRDIVLGSGEGRFPITVEAFSEIGHTDAPKRMAFVDGGNGTLEESPNFLIAINRVYFSLFEGRQRIRPTINQRIEFFSCLTIDTKESGGIRCATRIFAHDKKDMEQLPEESDMATDVERSSVLDGARFDSHARKFAEWQMAINVVKTQLRRGDMIVLDGSLQTGFKNEAKYAARLYKAAQDKGVIVCGLAKTSRLITESGEPLLSRITEIARGASYGRWHVRVAEKISADDMGFVFAVKLHENARFAFRFEILKEQYDIMKPDELDLIFASLAENSQDIAMLGYPYGSIDADRFAQVRCDERDMYQRMLESEKMHHPEWMSMPRYGADMGAHDVLNEVTG